MATITDDNVQWYRHTGDYDVSENQYLTRFFFVAGETAFDKNGGDGKTKAGTVGNHLDNVSFSETLQIQIRIPDICRLSKQYVD